VFEEGAADFVQRLHDEMAANEIGHPPDGCTHDDFIPGAVVEYVEALMGDLKPDEPDDGLSLRAKDDAAKGKYLYQCYRQVLVPRGQAYAKAWGIPYPHELMVGDGKLLRMWKGVFGGAVPFKFAEEK